MGCEPRGELGRRRRRGGHRAGEGVAAVHGGPPARLRARQHPAAPGAGRQVGRARVVGISPAWVVVRDGLSSAALSRTTRPRRPHAMPDRLSPLDASFLFAEHRTAAMHVGGVLTFAPPEDGEFDPEAFTKLIGQRLALVPQYRRKLREVPGGLGLPVWVDDPDFDLAYHVRRSALPAPGSPGQLRELVGRLLGRRLDRSRPLWEVYLVEGLAGGGFAVLTKTHHALVDGLASMDIGSALLDLTPQPRATPDDDWSPAPEPTGLELAAVAAGEALRRPALVLDRAGRAASDVRETVAAVGRTVQGVMSAGRSAASTRPVPVLNAATGTQRRYGMARTSIEDHRAVRRAHGGTVNDVVLAVVAGGLGRWLADRGEPVEADAAVRALVPVSVRARSRATGTGTATGGNSISACLL